MEKKITGTLYSYYFLCKRKLWYSANNIDMEQENENVAIGKILGEKAYSREDKDILIDDTINVDFIRNGIIYEVKKSKKVDEMAINQVKYYLYYLKGLGIDINKAIINYPLLREKQTILLEQYDIDNIKSNLEIIDEIISSDKIPTEFQNKNICKKCAYFPLCYA
jgi:CRISPR-associated exonuclease Cas4